MAWVGSPSVTRNEIPCIFPLSSLESSENCGKMPCCKRIAILVYEQGKDNQPMLKHASNVRRFDAVVLLAAIFLTVVSMASAQPVPLEFSKEFNPDIIGPGSTTMLTFTIDNTGLAVPVDELAFFDTLPSGVTIAAPAAVSNSCNGTVTAPAGGTTISLSGGQVAAGAVCTVVVHVTGESGEGPYTNTSGDLTSDAGNSGTAEDDLTVTEDLPGFTKSFAPGSVSFGGRSTLTFTIDNTANESVVEDLSFADNLPPGMVVANPANASTDCENPLLPAVLIAVPGTSVISLSANGTNSFPTLASGSECTVTVDVIGGAVGLLGNVTGDLLVDLASTETAGKASAVLEVTGVEDLLELAKDFTDDPVAPGGTVTLEFTVTNKSRDDSATGITFSDDLETTLTGLTPTLPPTPDPPCGAGSSLAFSLGVLTLTGGSLPPESFCTFSVELSVPAGAVPGAYPNTAGPVSGDVGGSPETGNPAGDLLFVVSFPVLTKEFTDDPVGAGDSVTLEFTITNPEGGSAMSNIAFDDELTTFLPFPVSVSLPPTPNPPCGAGSSLSLVPLGVDGQGLSLTGGSLAAAGSAGDSCTFSVTIDIPAGFPEGTYTNTTEEITGVLDDFPGPPTVAGPPASDDIVVVGAPSLTKEFTDDPVPPGGTATLEFTLTHDASAPADATGIGFTDDLAALVPAVVGLTATLPPTPDPPCGAGSSLSGSAGDTFLTFAGGTLAPGASCTFSVSVSVPAGGPSGLHANKTSEVTATVDGVAVTGNGAEDKLLVTGLLFSKAFTDDPVIAGGTATLEFTLDNTTGTADATDIIFTDNLGGASGTIPGLAAAPPLPVSPCGATTFIGTTSLIFIGGSVAAGTSCSFSVNVLVPPGTADDFYANVTSSLSATIGAPVTLPAATDQLEVSSTLLELTKAFTDDPAVPEGTVTLEFNLTNLDGARPATDIAFTDDLAAALPGLTATHAALNACGGMAAGFPTTNFDYAGGNLAAGASCTIRLSLTVPAGPLPAGSFTNTTSGVTGTIDGLPVTGEPASDDLEVDLLTFDKAFDGPAEASGTVDLTFTIANLDSANPATGLSFSDNLGAVIPGLAATGMPASNVCGSGSQLAGTSFLTLTGGTVPAGGSCDIVVTLQIPAGVNPDDYTNTTSVLFGAGIPKALPAVDDLTILSSGIDISKTPDLQTIASGGTADFTITVTNTGTSDLTNVVVTDPFAPGCDSAIGDLGQGAQVIYGCSLSNVLDSFTNTATVAGDSPFGGQVSDADTADVEVLSATSCFTDSTATGTGSATMCFGNVDVGCDFVEILFIQVEGDPQSPPGGTSPEGVDFPHGLVIFTVGNDCPAGFTADFSWELPGGLPPNTEYWKYGPTPGDTTPHWYVLPSIVVGNTVTFSVTDGGLGDDDLTANGTIVDQGGPGAPAGAAIPAMSTRSTVLFVVLLSLLGVVILRRRLE
jgi:uncharacterized repeat protein (TIGR01451 family)